MCYLFLDGNIFLIFCLQELFCILSDVMTSSFVSVKSTIVEDGSYQVIESVFGSSICVNISFSLIPNA